MFKMKKIYTAVAMGGATQTQMTSQMSRRIGITSLTVASLVLVLMLMTPTISAQTNEELDIQINNLLYNAAPLMVKRLEPLVQECWALRAATTDDPAFNAALREKCNNLEGLLATFRKIANRGRITSAMMAEIRKPIPPPPVPPGKGSRLKFDEKKYDTWVADLEKLKAELGHLIAEVDALEAKKK